DVAGVKDGPVLLAQRHGQGEEELFVALVVRVPATREAARRDRGHEGALDLDVGERGAKVLDVARYRFLAGVRDRSSEVRHRAGGGKARRAQVLLVELVELLPAATIRDRAELETLGRARDAGSRRCSRGPAAETSISVALP